MAPSTYAQRKHPERITCSHACKSVIRAHPTLGWIGKPNTQVTKSCEQCGTLMSVKKCLLQRKRFCSRVCAGRALLSSSLHKPGRIYTANSGSFKPGDNVGEASAQWKEPIKFTCGQCLQPFGLKPYVVRARTVHGGYAPRYCSNACHLAHIRANPGQASFYWKGGSANYRGPNWRTVRLKVIHEQHGLCFECGVALGTRLHVHHRQRFKSCATTAAANRRENLVGLCRKCHGKADGQPDAFREFNAVRRARAGH